MTTKNKPLKSYFKLLNLNYYDKLLPSGRVVKCCKVSYQKKSYEVCKNGKGAFSASYGKFAVTGVTPTEALEKCAKQVDGMAINL